MGQTPHTLLSLRGYLYSLRGEEPLRPAAYGAAAGRRGEWGRMGLLVCGFAWLWGWAFSTSPKASPLPHSIRPL